PQTPPIFPYTTLFRSGDGRRLEQHAVLAQRLGQREDVLVVLDVVLGQVAVQQVDPTLEVDVVGREVLQADLPVERGARPPHAGRSEEHTSELQSLAYL